MELYCFQAEINSTGFPLAYLLLENNGNCDEGICTAHIKRAVMTRLQSNKETRDATFNLLSEFGTQFLFDGIEQSSKFCPKKYHEEIWKMMEKYLHQHLLIPSCDGQFMTGTLIRDIAIQETYHFCKERGLISLWRYLWCEWYGDQWWLLWARSNCENKILILKTTMIVEGHWKWICGCPYYLTSRFGICKHLVQQKGAVTSDFFDRIKRNHQLPFLTEYD
ncbi:1527_t:CDS:2, partial [Scutellospora calospora]